MDARLRRRRPPRHGQLRSRVAVHRGHRGRAAAAGRRLPGQPVPQQARVGAGPLPDHLHRPHPRHPRGAVRHPALLVGVQARRHRRLHPADRHRRPDHRGRRDLPQLARLLRRRRPAHVAGRQPRRSPDRDLGAGGVQPDEPGGAAVRVPRADPQQAAHLARPVLLLHHQLGRAGLLLAAGDGVRALSGLHRAADPPGHAQGAPADPVPADRRRGRRQPPDHPDDAAAGRHRPGRAAAVVRLVPAGARRGARRGLGVHRRPELHDAQHHGAGGRARSAGGQRQRDPGEDRHHRRRLPAGGDLGRSLRGDPGHR